MNPNMPERLITSTTSELRKKVEQSVTTATAVAFAVQLPIHLIATEPA